MGQWYKLVRTCDCGSEMPFKHWVKDDEGKPLFKVCARCEDRKIKSHQDSISKEPQK